MNQMKQVWSLCVAGGLLLLSSCAKETLTPAPVGTAATTRTMSVEQEMAAVIKKASPVLYSQLTNADNRAPIVYSYLTGKFHLMADYPDGSEHWTCMQLDNRFCIAIVKPGESTAPNPHDLINGMADGTIAGTQTSVGEINSLNLSAGNYYFIANEVVPSARRLSSISVQQSASGIEGVCVFN